MNALLKLANKIESQLRKDAVAHIFQQINELVSAAYATFQLKPELDKMMDTGDIYGQSNKSSLHDLIGRMYFAASALREDVLKKGVSQADMAARKQRIMDLCDRATSFLQANGIPVETVGRLGLNLVKAKAEALVPVSLPALQPAAPKPAPAAAPQAEGTGSAFIDSDPTRWYRDDPTPGQLDGALDLLRQDVRGKTPVNHSGIREIPLREIPAEYL